MSDNVTSGNRRVMLNKYPNRRYYDITRSRHVTLDEIYTLIRDGYDVHVADSKTGDDITAKVLAQIILERDSPKLGIFPVELLHQLIRANEPLIRDFVDKYFNQALAAFLQSQRQFEHYLRHVLGLRTSLPIAQDWARLMMAPFAQAFVSAGSQESAMPATPEGASGAPDNGAANETAEDAADAEAVEDEDLRKLVSQLQQQVARLQQRLEQR